jgi:DNA-binding NtrC family response regulator
MDKILVVDDELSIRESFTLILEGKYKILTAASGEAAIKHTADQKIDLIYLDIRMPGLNGLETLKRIKEIDPTVEVVMVTAVNDVQKAGQAIKLGARDYIIKPFDVEAIQKMTEAILRRRQFIQEGKIIQEEAHKKTLQLIGGDEKIEAIAQIIQKIAPTNLRVLILGEAGTEKELVARLIHEGSQRRELPFASFPLSEASSPAQVKINLFGLEKGSTTADLRKKAGILEDLRGGTLLLNHVEHLDLSAISQKPVEGRLLASSDKPDLAEKRKEIFDYFSEVLVSLPPLRERISDLPLLVKHFLELFNRENGREVKEVSKEAMEVLFNYSWPGNVDQLKLLLERLVITATSDQITSADLPLDLLVKSTGSWGSNYLSLFEDEFSARAGSTSER